MKEVKVEFIVEIPDDLYDRCSIEEIQDWVEFEIGYNGCFSAHNPLRINDRPLPLKIKSGSVWVDDE